MRCDLHVHSIASGMFTAPGLNRICRESYTDPAEVYERMKRMSMSIVTLTDHDSIDGVGQTYTEVPGARTVDEFFAGLRTGRGRIHGVHGSCGKLTADVFSIVRSLFWDKPWTLALSPLAVLVPAFTAGHWLNEIRFCRKWSSAIERGEKRKRKLWDLDSNFEANWAS